MRHFIVFAIVGLALAQVKIDNSLRDPEMVYQQHADVTQRTFDVAMALG